MANESKDPGLRVVDFEKRGNVVRYYMGYDLDSAWGDDWDDVSYENNAEPVDSEYYVTVWDVVYPFDARVLEPADSSRIESGWCKDDMKKRRVPCIVVVPAELIESNCWLETFENWVADDRVTRIYFGDTLDDLKKTKCLFTDRNLREVYQNEEF